MKLKDYISQNLSRYHSYQKEFHEAVNETLEDIDTDELNALGLKQETAQRFFERFIEPDRIIRFKVEWDDDQGRTQINRAWRVQFNNALGVYKGGLRFHPTCDESTLKFLAYEQIFKNALTGLPMGGAKGGSDFDPKDKSRSEVKRFCQAFMSELYKYIGSDIDVPAGDIGVGTTEIGILYGQYLKLTNSFEGVLTGKHPHFGGSCGRAEATGHGVIYLLREALKQHDQSLSGKTILISGSGNVALYAVDKAIDCEAKVLTVSDSNGTLHFKNGITKDQLKQLIEHKHKNKMRLKDWKKSYNRESDSSITYHPDTNPWQFNAEIIIPCATQNELDEEDAKKLLKSDVVAVAEGANMPLTSKAVYQLHQRQVIYLPGKAANAGGVAVSGLERSQNASYIPWDMKTVDEHLQEIMQSIHKNCIKYIEKENGIYPYKKGANIYAFRKIYSAIQQLWPTN